MSSDFDSFDESTLGAFRESALGARSGSIKGKWFLAMTGANEWVSDNGISWEQQASVVPTMGFIGERGFLPASYTDSPYTSAIAFSGGASGNTLPISAFNKLFLVNTTTNLLYFSSDNGASWSQAALPASDGVALFNRVTGNVFLSSTGRVLVPVGYGAGAAKSGYVAYTNDGINWTLSATLGFSAAFATHEIYESNGVVYALAGTGIAISTDDAETFSSLGAASFPSTSYATFFVMSSGRVVVFNPNTAGYSYTDDNFVSFTTVATYNIFFDELNLLYAYRTDTDNLYESSDGSSWSVVVTSPTTLVSGSGRPVRVGMLR